MAWIYIHQTGKSGTLVEMTGNFISCQWSIFRVNITQPGSSGEEICIDFASQDEMKTFYQTLIEAIKREQKFIDTAEEGMSFKSCH